MTVTPSRGMKRSIREAFQHAEHVVELWDRYPDEFVVIPATSPLARRLFSRQRQRIIELVRTHGPFDSVEELAHELDRDPTRVSRDLESLTEAGLLHTVRRGKRKRVEPSFRPVIIQ